MSMLLFSRWCLFRALLLPAAKSKPPRQAAQVPLDQHDGDRLPDRRVDAAVVLDSAGTVIKSKLHPPGRQYLRAESEENNRREEDDPRRRGGRGGGGVSSSSRTATISDSVSRSARSSTTVVRTTRRPSPVVSPWAASAPLSKGDTPQNIETSSTTRKTPSTTRQDVTNARQWQKSGHASRGRPVQGSATKAEQSQEVRSGATDEERAEGDAGGNEADKETSTTTPTTTIGLNNATATSTTRQALSGSAFAETGAPATSVIAPFRVHLVVLADANFAETYRKQIQTLRCYANYWGYNFERLPLNMSEYASVRVGASARVDPTKATKNVKNIPTACPEEEGIRGQAFFVRHCLLAGYLKEIAEENDAVFLLDADIVARKFTPNLDRWVGKLLDAPVAAQPEAALPDITFFERSWGVHDHNEIMAGTYLARNTGKTRTFLTQWASMAKTCPSGFSSADNGAIHLAIPRALGISTKKCEDQFSALNGTVVTGMDSYFEFVACCREELGMGATPDDEVNGGKAFENAREELLVQGVTKARARKDPEAVVHQDKTIVGIRVSILAKDEAWAPDAVYMSEQQKERTPLGHGVKHIDNTQARAFLAWKSISKCEDNDGRKLVGQVEAPRAGGQATIVNLRPELFPQNRTAAGV